MLADAEMQIPAPRRRRLKVAGFGKFQCRLGRGREVRGAAQEPGNVPGERVQHFAGRVASGNALRVRRKARQIAVPSRWELAALHLVDLGGELRELPSVGGKEGFPACARRGWGTKTWAPSGQP